MPRLSQLLGDRAEATVSFPGADVLIVYRPSVYTREFEAKLSSLETDTPNDEASEMCDEMLSALIVDWDLTDDDDELIPPKRGQIAARVPVMFLVLFVQKLVQAIAGEAAGGRKTQTAQPTPPTPMNRAARRAAGVHRVK